MRHWLRTLLVVSLTIGNQYAFCAACCAGGNPKSFIQLQRLQKYELGVMTSFRDAYGRFDSTGLLVSTEKNQTVSFSLGGGIWILDGLQGSLTVPIVEQIQDRGRQGTKHETGVGDITLGLDLILVETLFIDDWYPTIRLHTGNKFPTGTEPTYSRVGTGNGLWEPFFGISLVKPIDPLTFSVRANYTFRPRRDGLKTGDWLELSGTTSLAVSRRFSFSFGGSYHWISASDLNHQEIVDSNTRYASATVGANYFLTPVWSVGISGDTIISIENSGQNQLASRSLSATLRYGFY